MGNEWMFLVIGLVAFLTTYGFTYFLIPRLRRFRMVGKDVNKPDQPEVAEMGGIAIVAGFTSGVMLAVFLQSFWHLQFNLVHVLGAIIAVHSIAFIGMVDDLLNIPQWLKALLPLAAAVPLVAVRAAGSTAMAIPFIGWVDLGVLYILVLVPLGVTVASNLTNMLAGFNGMESGMGLVMFLAMVLLALVYGKVEMLVLFIPILGALLGFLPYNIYPSRIFPGDVGNLTFGAVLAAGVIVGNLEAAGAILLLPYIADFFIKAYNRFPSSQWWGVYRQGRLHAPQDQVRGLAQLFMRWSGGISEQRLTMAFIAMEAMVALFTLAVFWPRT